MIKVQLKKLSSLGEEDANAQVDCTATSDNPNPSLSTQLKIHTQTTHALPTSTALFHPTHGTPCFQLFVIQACFPCARLFSLIIYSRTPFHLSCQRHANRPKPHRSTSQRRNPTHDPRHTRHVRTLESLDHAFVVKTLDDIHGIGQDSFCKFPCLFFVLDLPFSLPLLPLLP